MADEKDALDRAMQLATEIQSHRARLNALVQELPPEQLAQVIAGEVCDTIMSLFADFAQATVESLADEREFIMEEIVPPLDELLEEDGPDSNESQLTVQDAGEFSALLTHYRAILQAQHDVIEAPEVKTELQSWITRADAAIGRTLAIALTEDPDEPEEEDDEPEEPAAGDA